MSAPAHVTSIEALRAFRRALKLYEQATRDSLGTLTAEMRRAVNWISDDRTRYWPAQQRKAEELVAAARTDLELCRMASLKNEQRSCIQEKKNLERAIARQRHCEKQVQNVGQWRHTVEHQADETTGKMARLTHYLDTDIPKAIATLDRMIDALEKYTQPGNSPGGE
jgi:hypothetical protein